MFFGKDVNEDYTEVPIKAIKAFNKSRSMGWCCLTKADQDIYIYLLRGKSKPIKSNEIVGYGRRKRKIGSYYDVTRHYKTISKNTGYSTHTISISIERLEWHKLILTDGRKYKAICTWEGRDKTYPNYNFIERVFNDRFVNRDIHLHDCVMPVVDIIIGIYRFSQVSIDFNPYLVNWLVRGFKRAGRFRKWGPGASVVSPTVRRPPTRLTRPRPRSKQIENPRSGRKTSP